jgi:hypothetical protein
MHAGRRFPLFVYFSVIQRTSHRRVDSMFLPFMSRLRFLEIYLDLLSFLMGSLSFSLTSPDHLEFNIQIHGYNRFNPNTFYRNLRNAWSHLDSIAIHPNGSRLQRVDININYTSFCEHDDGAGPDRDELLKAVFDGLPLLHKKGVLFVEAVLGK